MKARIPKHREFIIDFPKEVSQEKADEGWEKLTALLEDYKKAHNGQSVYSPTFIEDLEPAVKELQAEYGFTYTVETCKIIAEPARSLLECEDRIFVIEFMAGNRILPYGFYTIQP